MLPPTAERIMEVGFGFWASKVLLSAVEIEVFTELAKHPGDLENLQTRLGLHPRSARDFLDALVAMGFLRREGNIYYNAPDTDMFLDKQKPSYIGGILEMANHRLFGFWGHLSEALRTGEMQNEAKGGENFFGTLYADCDRLKEFLRAMSGVSRGANICIAERLPWSNYKSFVDVGTAQGDLAVQIAKANPHLSGIGFDLPVVAPVFEDYVAEHALGDRIRFIGGDFFKDDLPNADVILMGHILHDWSLEEKKILICKAYASLPENGLLVAYDALIDDERCKNLFGLLMSLNMLIETTAGFDYTGADCCEWMKEAGFRETRVEHLIGPDSIVVGRK
ncbi:methyltransferase [Chlorogloeopsis sp. ULAP01]|uniref:methyltransferase n=1 Tax=Chlorogloeopsis sp. ULAP01 TaxID=3056483 RepID=UPI0025AA44EB|nr:methyltransferase [Chlorogloeopsis sp. ULAP01]MDM9383904.1 methyltransferase [Chlorogloeopsis sp. ULAP01]